MSNERTYLPILDDRPTEEDYLDFESYRDTLAALVLHEHTRTPVTLGGQRANGGVNETNT